MGTGPAALGPQYILLLLVMRMRMRMLLLLLAHSNKVAQS